MFFNRIVAPRFLGREGDLDAADKAECEELPPLLDYLEQVLPESGWLVEDRLTLADIAVASPLVNLGHLGVDYRRRPAQGSPPSPSACSAATASGSWVEREIAFLARAA